jgi:amidophosphoribosyltransferase
MFASESAAIENNGFDLIGDLNPAEAVIIDMEGQVHRHKCCETVALTPCIFEYVYFARADSYLDGVSVYAARLNMGHALAKKVMRLYPHEIIDAVIPIPDTSRAAALQMAESMGIPYRDGFVKNRYIARTFIMAGQEARKKNVRKKLSPLRGEFTGKNVLLVDDSIIRGNTASQVVKMVRQCGAKRVYLCSASPGVRHPNIYGIDMPATDEYIAYNRNEQQVAEAIGADWVVYQDLGDLEECVRSLNPTRLKKFDSSCFNGRYVTGNVNDAFLRQLARKRSASRAICSN